MAQPTIPLFIDVQNKQLVRSFTSTTPAVLPPVYYGDTLNLKMEFLQATGVPSAPYTDIDYSDAAVTVSVGNIGARPFNGDFTITDTDANQTTGVLAYNATSAQVQAAIQAALTTNWLLATVYGGTGGPYTVTNGANGSHSALIGTSVSLEPPASIVINTLQPGTGSTPQMEYVTLSVNPLALQDTWTASSGPDVLQGLIALTSSNLEQVLGNSPFVYTTFAINVVPQSGEPFTVYQNNFVIRSSSALGAPSAPAPGVSYYTASQSDARYLRSLVVVRNSTGNEAQHISTFGVGSNNILYLLTNANTTINFTFDNGTFDGQTVTYSVNSSIHSITYSANVTGVLSPDSIGFGGTVSFMWDADNSVWIPI